MTSRRIFAVLPAAGIGARMRADCPKQYLPLAGRPLAEHTLERLLAIEAVSMLQVALHAADDYWPTLAQSRDARIHTCQGGDDRASSVLKALAAIRERVDIDAADWVLVHDMARPCVRREDIAKLLAVADAAGGLLAQPVVDTIKQAVDGANGGINEAVRVARSLDRAIIWRALTPQFFPFETLETALKQARAKGALITDEASAMELAGFHPRLVAAHSDNIKVTRPEDLALAAFYLQQQRRPQ